MKKIFYLLLFGVLFRNISTAQTDAIWAFNGANNITTGGSVTPRAVKVDQNTGDIYVLGHFSTGADFDPGAGVYSPTVIGTNLNHFLAKYSASGSLLWCNNLGVVGGNIEGYGLAIDNSGVYITGQNNSPADFDPSPAVVTIGAGAYVVKYTTAGVFVWGFSINSVTAYGLSIAPDPTGNFIYVAGQFGASNVQFGSGVTLSTAGSSDIFLAKYSSANGGIAWANRFGAGGGDVARGVATDASGNVYLGGNFTSTVNFDPSSVASPLTSAGGIDFFVAKYNSAGNYIWANRIGASNNDELYSLDVDVSANIAITGYYVDAVDFDPGAGVVSLPASGFSANSNIFIAKYNTNGNYVWANGIGSTGNESGYGVEFDNAGDVVATGFINGTIDFDPGAGVANRTLVGGRDIFLAKYNGANGNYVWANTMGGVGNDDGWAVALTSTNNAVFAGAFTGSIDYDPDVSVGNFFAPSTFTNGIFGTYASATGAYTNAFQLGAFYQANVNFAETGTKTVTDATGNVYVAGTFEGIVDFDPSAGTHALVAVGSSDGYIAKYSGNGAFLGAIQLGGVNGDNVYDMKIDADGNVVICGSFSGTIDINPTLGVTNLVANGLQDIYFAKFNASLNLVWGKSIGGGNDDVAYGLDVDASRNIYITGYYVGTVDFDPNAGVQNLNGHASTGNVFLAKYDASGNWQWANNIGGTGNESGYSVAVDGVGNVIVTGEFSGTPNFNPLGTANLTAIGLQDIFMAKYNAANGNYIWAKNMGSINGNNRGVSVAANNGNIYLFGFFRNTVDFDPDAGVANLASNGGQDIFVAWYTANGVYNMAYKLGGTSDDITGSMLLDQTGSVIISGSFQGTVDFDLGAGVNNKVSLGGGSDAFYYKFNGGLNAQAFKVFGSIQTDRCNHVATNAAGDIFATGLFGNNAVSGTVLDFNNNSSSPLNVTGSRAQDFFLAKYSTCTQPTTPSITGTTNICSGSSTTLSIGTGSLGSATNWVWFTGSCGGTQIGTGTSIIVSPTSNTSYWVRAQGGCVTPSACGNTTVSVTAAPNAGTLSGTQTICAAATTTFSSTVSGGSWSSSNNTIATVNATTGVVTGVAAGTATITYTVTGSGGCANATATRTINVTAAPIAGTLSGIQTICAGATTTFSSTVSGGTWSSSNTGIATVNATTGIVTSVAAGTATITYTVTGTGGCSNAIATRSVTISTAPSAGTLSGNQTICAAATTTFSSTISGGSWSSSNNAIATVNATTGVITGVAAGTATITYTVTGTGGCLDASATRTVTVTAAPNAGTLSGNQNICAASTTTFSATVGGGTWSSSNTGVATVNATSGVVTGVSGGTATITYTVSGTGGCSNATATRTVNVTAAPSAGTLSGDQNVCIGLTTIFSSTVSGGSWSSSNTGIATINATSGLITGLTAGMATMTYTVTGTGGCASISATRTVNVSSATSAGTLSGNQTICLGTTTTFSSTVSGGTWSSSNTGIATVNATTGIVTSVAAGTATITYTVAGTGGCTNGTATRTVTISTAPSAGTLSGNQTICAATTTTFSSTISGGSWSSSNNAIATVNATTGVITGVAAGTATITYTVTGTGGCLDASATRTVTVTAAPNAGTLSGNQNICAASTTTFSATVGGGSWSSSNTAVATVNATSGVVTGVSGGTATITYTVSGTGGCSNATATRTVNVTAAPSAGTLSGSQGVCIGSTVTFSSTVNGGTWSSSDVSIALINTSTGVVTGVSAGTATMTYTIAGTGGCSHATAIRTVTVNPIPNASINGPTTICSGLSATLTASGGGTYAWSNSLGSAAAVTVSPTTATTYTVTVTNNSCTATASQTVSVQSAPTAVINGASSVCAGSSITLTANGGNTYAWSNSGGNAAAATFSPTTTTTYTVTASLGAGCTATATKTITIKQPTSGSYSQTICFGQSVLFNGISRSQSGAYLDTLVNLAGCDSFLTLNLTVRPQITGSIAQTVCFGGSTTFNGATLTQSGVFKDTLTSVTGCDSILTLIFTVRPRIATSITQPICNGSAITFNGQTITTAGTYLDTLTSVNGCDSFITLNVTIAQATAATISKSACGSFSFGGNTLTVSGTYLDTISNVAGCDSVITLNLTINQATASSMFDTICNGDSYSFGAQTLNQSGTYNRTITNVAGCDSVITLNLFVRPAVAVTASASGFNLSATAGFVAYQWKLNGSAISGANTQTYTAVANGAYTIEVTDANGCKGTSNTVNVVGVGIDDLSNLNLTIYPNPATDIITIETEEQVTGVELFSAIGQKINVTTNAKQQINISDLAAGAYSLIIHTTNGSIQKRFVKE